MLLLVTIGLVLIAAVSLIIGFVQNSLAPIYVSIACSVAAAAVLLLFSRLSRRQVATPAAGGPTPLPDQPTQAVALSDSALPAPEAVPMASEAAMAVAVSRGAEAEVGPTGAGAFDGFPIADYDDLKVAEITPLLDELDDDELDMVREREEAGRARATILRRIDALLETTEAEPASAADGAESGGGGLAIDGYDDLKVSEILPMLTQLDADELEGIRDYEESAAARATILKRIDQLLNRGEPAAATTGRATKAAKAVGGTANKAGASAKKAAGASAKKVAGSAQKAAGSAKRAAATTAGGVTKAAATKAGAKKAGSAKKAGGARKSG